MTVPTSVSAVYSEVDMRLSLVTESNPVSPCTGAECELDRDFDQKVLRLGTGLAKSAFAAYPDLATRLDKFEFVIAEKANPGTVSNASGKVVIFRGVQKLHLGDETLAFLIAREMGHVISRHHEENSATKIMFSVLAAMFIPVSNIISGSAALVQTASASSMYTAVASTASYLGSKLTIESNKLDQLQEADLIALNLLGRMGWQRSDVAKALATSTRVMGDDSWSNTLRNSTEDAFNMKLAQQDIVPLPNRGTEGKTGKTSSIIQDGIIAMPVRLTSAQNSITELNIDSNGNGRTIIKVGMVQPLANLPAGFTTKNPPRIVLDFPNTTNGLGKSVQNSREGNDLHSTNIVQVAERTRLVVNLNRIVSYNTRIEGNSLMITLQSKDTDITAPKNSLRIAEVDQTGH
jgi:hypothetical protein